jgi:HAD superfamily hydrolase (TIGR01509 family)
MIKAVIFDLDGTLTSFNLDYRTVRAEARSYLVKMGIPPIILEVNESIFKMLQKTERFLSNQGRSRRVTREIQSEVLAIAESYEWEAAKSTKLLSGVVDTLNKLEERRIKMGLFTINSEKSVKQILRRFNLAGFFDVVIPRNRVRYIKPHTEHLRSALKELGVNPEESMVVGDGTSDMMCAQRMGVVSVGLPTGISSVDGLINAGAHYVVTSIMDLPLLIDEIRKISGRKR